jgi:iron-sulfur cluster assembly accessory protein
MWPYTSGTVRRPVDGHQTMFLSQLPYVPLGDLRTVLSYPAKSGEIADDQIQAVLTKVALSHLTSRLNEEEDWAAPEAYKGINGQSQKLKDVCRMLGIVPLSGYEMSGDKVFDLVEAAEPDDLKIERDGAAALVDEVSLPLLKGSEIDFLDELAGAEFRVRNPNAKSSCGCGVSFSI